MCNISRKESKEMLGKTGVIRCIKCSMIEKFLTCCIFACETNSKFYCILRGTSEWAVTPKVGICRFGQGMI